MAVAVSNVIKGGVGLPCVGSLGTLELSDHLEEAARIRRQAREEANELIRRASEEASLIRRDAYDSGYAEGRSDGQRKGREEGFLEGRAEGFESAKKEHGQSVQKLIGTLQSAAAALDEEKESNLLMTEKNILECVLSLVSKIAADLGRFDRCVVERNLKRAVRHVGSATALSLRVHPDDVSEAKLLTGNPSSSFLSARHIEVVADESIHRGGVLLKTPDTTVDATIDSQLNAIRDLLLASYRKSEA